MRDSKIKLDDDYRIESDTSCWTLVFDKITGKDPKTGKDKRRYETWYYPTLETALRGYRDLAIKGSKSVNDVLARIASSDEIIKKALEKAVLKPDDKVLDATKKKLDKSEKNKK